MPTRLALAGRKYKDAKVRFYFDADVLGLARVMAGLRPDVTYPGDKGGVVHRQLRPACPIASTAVKDSIWIPEVTHHGWLIVTRDSRIQHHRAEIDAVRTSGARMVALGGKDARGTFEQLEVLMTRWRDIEKLHDQSGPFIYVASRSGFRKVDIS